jgi:hypothetical protein
MMKRTSHLEALISSILSGCFFLALGLLAVWGYLSCFAPKPYQPPAKPFAAYDRKPMLDAMAPGAVRSRLDAVAALGDRFLGKPGFYRTEELIRNRYQAAGLGLHEQEIRTVAPQTEFAQALASDGSPADFALYPFMPNFLQPVATPDAGITGTLLKVDDALLRSRTSFEGCFALIDGAEPEPAGYGYAYAKYAQFGFEGVVISHSRGLDAMSWDQVTRMTTVNPVNFLRVAADPGVFRYVGQKVTLRVRVRYREVPNRTLVGILKAARPTRAALVIPCSYDALSMLPDRSPGLLQALPVAIQLQLLEGLKSYQGNLSRDVIFVAFGGRVMAHDPQDRLISAIGSTGDRKARRAALLAEQGTNARALAALKRCRIVLDALSAPDAPERAPGALAGLDETAAGLFMEQLRYVLNTLVFERSEAVLAAKIRFEKGKAADTRRPEFEAYQLTRKAYDKAFSCAGLPLRRLLADQAEFVAEVALPSRLGARLAKLVHFHEVKARGLGESLELNAAFAAYDRLVVFAPELVPQGVAGGGAEGLTLTMGRTINHHTGGQPMIQAVQEVIQELKLVGQVSFRYTAARDAGETAYRMMARQDAEAACWAAVRIPAYSLVSHGRSYAAFGYPCEQPWMRNVDSLEGSLKVAGATVLSLAHGNGEFKPLTRSQSAVKRYSGNVYVANVGQSILPNYPLTGAVVMGKPSWNVVFPSSGYCGALVMMSDDYGRYGREYSVVPFAEFWSYSPDAAGYDSQGGILLVKDEGPRAQRTFASVGLGLEALANDVNLICYRAAPVTLLDLINPQSMKSYAGAQFMKAQGLSVFDSTYSVRPDFITSEGIQTAFIKPDEYFCVALKAGAAGNELVQTTRAFLLGGPPVPAAKASHEPGSEIQGRGFLAAETPLIREAAREAARSMAEVNGKRLALQDSYGMADEQTHDFQARTTTRLEPGGNAAQSRKANLLQARDALTYATLNHPVLRRNIFEAVAGILWYLGLLVPFAFFFEKLVFGFTDIRKQLGAHVVIFLVVFALLKLLHPAFAMIRSSVMILLGFVIFLISTGILAMFSSRFKENLESLKKSRGQVTAAEVNKIGAIATAFMLGLNNMHRRRIRTLLTCGTLVLITFVMICFTSVRNDITDTTIAIGKAPFNGFVVKNEEYRPVSEAELFALQTKYADRYKVAPRSALFGTETRDSKERLYPELRLVYRDGQSAREARPLSVLTVSCDEPLASRLAVEGRWFTEEDASRPGHDLPVILSRAMADKLKLDRAAIAAGRAPRVEINGNNYSVCGVFEGKALDGLMDLDGRNLLPFNIKALRDLNRLDQNTILASDDDPRIFGDDVILALTSPGQARLMSVAIVFPPTLSPAEARAEIEHFMEQSGRRTIFGLDGYAFLGKRARESSFVGLVDMLIPLLIAAMTVLNTIRGSVYERKEEIFVYNAVGIAPRHIFFMFFAEAFVYAVVGSVLGYILSQGTGRLLTALHLTGGLNMTFTSLGTIYASLTIAAAVFLSTWFPARTAMKIASPGDDLGWKLPQPDGDRLSFHLPFTFDWHDRIAVLAFFRRYFIDHGEGSSGPFFTGATELGISDKTDPRNGDGCIPTLTVPVWLKPFDLGVSQLLVIALPRDPETGEFVAEITLVRRSGTLDNWNRLNQFFVGRLREHFLHWRAVRPEERAEMFAEAKAKFEI